MLTLTPPSPRLRLTLLGVGVLVFLWLGFEDHGMLSVTILGTLVALLSVLMAVRAYGPHTPLVPRVWLPGFALTGALMGGSAILLTVCLMFFKTAWHSHAFPDYPVSLMALMLSRLPLWMIGGGCIGAGLGLWRWAKNN